MSVFLNSQKVPVNSCVEKAGVTGQPCVVVSVCAARGKADSSAVEQAQKRYHFFVSQKPITAGVLMANLTLGV